MKKIDFFFLLDVLLVYTESQKAVTQSKLKNLGVTNYSALCNTKLKFQKMKKGAKIEENLNFFLARRLVGSYRLAKTCNTEKKYKLKQTKLWGTL